MNELERIKSILVKNNLTPKKSFGQNFLVDTNIINNIISLFDYSKYLEVIEIGPGLGALTLPLVKKGIKVKAVDADRDMVKVLSEIFSDSNNIEIIQSDFLRYKLDKKTANNRLIIGNLPYNITSTLIEYLLENNFLSAGIMVQKEVGEKLQYIPSKKENTPLGLYLSCGYKISSQIFVPSSSFYPSPKVDSLFIKIDKIQDINFKYYSLFKIIFKDNNKTIRNCLKQNKETKDYLLKPHNDEINQLLLLRARQLDSNQGILLAEDILNSSINN